MMIVMIIIIILKFSGKDSSSTQDLDEFIFALRFYSANVDGILALKARVCLPDFVTW